jgi:predicted DNA-binding protein YlxM (UPF0122 family)
MLTKMKEAVALSKDAVLLKECIKREDDAFEKYKSVLKYDKFSENHRKTLTTHLDKTGAARSTMQELLRVV